MNAVVFGNGESRKTIDPSSLRDNYILIGCNAIHRDAVVDHLVCCDRRMVSEAVENKSLSKIYVRPDWYKYFRKIRKDKRISTVPELPYQGIEKRDQPINWGSGPYAVLLAATLKFENITLIGFDLYSNNNKVNNIYKGTPNYSAPEKQSVDYSYWVYQISKIICLYPEITFTIVNNDNWQMPLNWQQNNVKFKNISDFTIDL